ncbi:hypothetical protein LJC22_02320, partial [Desulfosarcina sp. OttesenSCG-928-G10]|nr:hypothetical protein [Desulfosarcina sp. OttesenSCG-928-G10]
PPTPVPFGEIIEEPTDADSDDPSKENITEVAEDEVPEGKDDAPPAASVPFGEIIEEPTDALGSDDPSKENSTEVAEDEAPEGRDDSPPTPVPFGETIEEPTDDLGSDNTQRENSIEEESIPEVAEDKTPEDGDDTPPVSVPFDETIEETAEALGSDDPSRENTTEEESISEVEGGKSLEGNSNSDDVAVNHNQFFRPSGIVSEKLHNLFSTTDEQTTDSPDKEAVESQNIWTLSGLGNVKLGDRVFDDEQPIYYPRAEGDSTTDIISHADRFKAEEEAKNIRDGVNVSKKMIEKKENVENLEDVIEYNKELENTINKMISTSERCNAPVPENKIIENHTSASEVESTEAYSIVSDIAVFVPAVGEAQEAEQAPGDIILESVPKDVPEGSDGSTISNVEVPTTTANTSSKNEADGNSSVNYDDAIEYAVNKMMEDYNHLEVHYANDVLAEHGYDLAIPKIWNNWTIRDMLSSQNRDEVNGFFKNNKKAIDDFINSFGMRDNKAFENELGQYRIEIGGEKKMLSALNQMEFVPSDGNPCLHPSEGRESHITDPINAILAFGVLLSSIKKKS